MLYLPAAGENRKNVRKAMERLMILYQKWPLLSMNKTGIRRIESCNRKAGIDFFGGFSKGGL